MAANEGIEAYRAVKETKPVIDLKVNKALSPEYSSKVADIGTELDKMRASLKSKDSEITSLKAELSEKDVTLRELEAELEGGRDSERKLLDSLGEQTKHLEETKILAEESKIEIASLKEKLDGSVDSQDSSGYDSSVQENESESLRMELESTKGSLARALEAAEASSLKLSNLEEEMGLVKKELSLATEAEITGKKAMDDLALALTEVAADCTQTKEKLAAAEAQLEAERLDAKQLKEKLEAMEENYETLLQEARKEAEVYKNMAERLRVEAEESFLAWNGKEAVFVSCIKRTEDEKSSLLDENSMLLQALMTAENVSKKAKDENHKLRDILKQAINEANVAKEAAGIARAENSQLKDALMDKEDEIQFALKEVERMRGREASANENVKNLRRLLSEAEMANEFKAEDKERNRAMSRQGSSGKDSSNKLIRLNSMQKDQEVEKKMDERSEQPNEKREDKKEKKENHKDKKEHNKDKKEDKKDKKEHAYQIDKRMGKTCSFSLRDFKISHSHTHKNNKDTGDEETKGAANKRTHEGGTDVESEANSPASDSDHLFKGSIFDVAETPHAATAHHHMRRSSLTFLEDGEILSSEEFEGLEDGENEKGGRKKKAFIKRFGDLLVRRKSFSLKKETTPFEQQEKLQQQQPLTPPTTPPQLQSPEH